MATNTANSPIRETPTGMYFFGHPVPSNVVVADVWQDYMDDCKKVRWRSRGDPTIHEMDLCHPVEESILAILAAMRLS